MKQLFLAVLLLTAFAFASLNAQNAPTRIQKQHDVSKFVKAHLNQSIEMLVRALEDKQYNMKVSALHTLRQIEQIFPDESFSPLVQPLIKLINDNNLETETRVLAAITLDQLHSDTGDAAIFMASQSSDNLTLKGFCQAITRVNNENILNSAQVK